MVLVALAGLAAVTTAVAPPAARLTDFHECPMVTPQVPPIPGVGCAAGIHAWTGLPCAEPASATVLIGQLPAARIGGLLVTLGPPDPIVKGSAAPQIGGLPATGVGAATSAPIEPCVANVHMWTGATCLTAPPALIGG